MFCDGDKNETKAVPSAYTKGQLQGNFGPRKMPSFSYVKETPAIIDV